MTVADSSLVLVEVTSVRRPRHHPGLALATLAAGLLSPGCTGRQPLPERPDLVLVTLDTCRADRLGAYGGPAGLTPALDRLASEGVVFEHAIAPAPLTLPSHASMLTGVLPHQHGVTLNGAHQLPARLTTTAEALDAGGYLTAAFVGSFILASRHGLAQGFEVYDEPATDSGAALRERPADEVISRARSFLAAHRRDEAPLFLWVHLYDPHAPYRPPPPFFERFARNPYEGEIAYVDWALQPWLEELRSVKRPTVLFVAGDHGESLGEHGERHHGHFVYDSTQRVPLLAWGPGVVREGHRVSAQVGSHRLHATLLELAGADLENEAAVGASLLPMLRGRRGSASADVTLAADLPLAHFGAVPLRALRTARYKWIRSPEPELYDLEHDAAELRNLAEELPELAARLDRLLGERLAAGAATAELAELDTDAQQALEALGYAASPPPESPLDPQLDAKHVAPLVDGLRLARHAAEQGRFDAALREVEQILAICPTTRGALMLGGHVSVQRQDYARAAHYFAALGERFPDDALAFYNLGLAELSGGRKTEAVTALERALEIDPGAGPTRFALAVALLAAQDRERGRAELERYLQEAESDAVPDAELSEARRLLEELRGGS